MLEEEARVLVERRGAVTPTWHFAVGPDQAIWTAPGGEARVLLVDRFGRLKRTINLAMSGAGGRPSVGAVGRLGDSMFVVDRAGGEVLFFGAHGDALGSWQLKTLQLESPFTRATPSALLADGTVLAVPSVDDRVLARGAAVSVPIVRGTRDGRSLGVVAHVQLGNAVVLVPTPKGDVMATFNLVREVLNDAPLWRLAPDRRHMILIERQASDDGQPSWFTVRKTDVTAAREVYSVRVPYVPEPIATSTVDSILAQSASPIRMHFPSAAAVDSALRSAVRIPLYYPPVFDLAVGLAHTTWVRRSARISNEGIWDVLDAQGELIARVRTRPDLKILYIGETEVWAQRPVAPDSVAIWRMRINRTGT